MSFDAEKVQRVLKKVPSLYRGPGGAVAVLKDGNLVGQHVWGYADMDRRIPITSQVLFPICSITKQFVSMLLLDLVEKPPPSMTRQGLQEQLLARLREVVPPEFVDESGLTVENLVDMCSGLRDYWALCTLQGSRPDTPYLLNEHNPDMLRRIRSLHFRPGYEYSYANTNFNVMERLIEHVTKDSLGNLFAERIFGPAKMKTARLCPRTDRLPAPIVGYEGSEKFGFFPAPNFIEWSADAGLVASLDDMVAYEKHFDRRYTDQQDSYRDAITPREYRDGARAKYRYGLRHADLGQYNTMGHGGALRGYKLMRRYVAGERLSVVVLFNHSASAPEAAEYILKQILDVSEPPPLAVQPVQQWFGSFLDPETQLSIRVRPGDVAGKIKIDYVRGEETLRLVDANKAESPDVEASIDGDILHVRRLDDNRVLTARRLLKNHDAGAMIDRSQSPVQGTYRCGETESTFICEGEGDMLYGLFDGCFGRGPPHLMTHLGEDVWVLADPRAMDDTPPGDWTVVFVRNEQGAVVKANIGCWLARKLDFMKV
ncbi:uncharacterized protein PV06_09126 [Exophiala oligosperma]|uniref:Beta-lactamase-related domain-containing protein n=1 Tax=Exophiala oligosperma TaxID=215243 RepID=A0A0D2D883_9EURO|nr:uncharacterized protein PV06_09126 [Exophiala oligosperma]KIW39348.1 hypothetical protein PV06_09126 [Exophiala oligosperma]